MQTVLQILLLTTALGLASAAVLLAAARPRGTRRTGRRAPRPAGPRAYPYADMPGFSREQLEAIARMPVPPHHDNDQVADGPRLRSALNGASLWLRSGCGRRHGILSADAVVRAPDLQRRHRRAF
jgi:hypothetical protein